MSSADPTRRRFLETSTALGSTLLLGTGRAGAESSSGCPLPHPPTPIPETAGIRYAEQFSGTLSDGTFTRLELQLEIQRLRAFLQGPHVANIVGGALEGRPGAPLTGTVELFRDCGAQGEKDFEVRFQYADASGRTVTGVGVRRLTTANERDPAAQLTALSLTLRVDGNELASGVLTSDVEDLLARLLSVTPHGVTGHAAEATRAAFFAFFNRSCESIHPELPPILAPESRLDPGERRALLLIATVMLPERLPDNGPTIRQAIDKLETFIANADADALGELRAQLRTLGKLGPVKQGISRAIRALVLGVLQSEKPHFLRAMLDSVHKVAVLGYYSHERADALIGYLRPQFAPLYRTRLPVRATPTPREFDVAIIGAGVAGSLIAERLTAAGKSVLILEAGPYVPEMELTTDESLWIAKLQKSSGLQRANEGEPYGSRVGSVVLLQGACVGGGGMINNAVNFMLPKRRLEQWLGLGFPIAPAHLRRSYLTTAAELDIGPVSEKTRFVNPVCALLENSFGKPKRPPLGTPPSEGFYECMVNLARERCLGCGMCNTGCGSERKRNALQVHLPRALAPDRDGELVANARVVDIVVSRGPGSTHRVDSLTVRTPSGDLRVRAREYVLSAGAINSSALMQRSPSLRAALAGLPIGKRFCANVVSPMLSFYEQPLHERPSLQLTHYYVPPGDEGYLIENLFNPPGQSALVMPGYGRLHHERMLRYRNTALTGIAIGTAAVGEVRVDSRGRTVTTLPMGENEHRRMRRGFGLLARALLSGGTTGRATEVIAGVLGGGFTMKTEDDIQRFDRWFESISRVVLSTGHPQGGSAMSLDPRISVVDGAFRVRGLTNLRVCDASVFPMVSGVNPQWTVLALADHCSRVMLDGE